MFNMKTSDLFRRAKQLADLEGSDFITWNEAENCINESYVGLYEKLISMGDNSFVKSYHTNKSEPLPPDFWQLKGVFSYNDGNLQVINRRADNTNTHFLSYELRNGNLELFGSPNDVLVEYYPKPKKLYFRPNAITVDLPEADYKDCCNTLFLYETTDTESNPILSVYDADGVKSVEGVLTPGTRNYITNNFVIAQSGTTVTIYDLTSGYSASISDAIPLVNEDGELFIIKDSKINNVIIYDNDYDLEAVKDCDISGVDFVASDNNFEDYFTLTDGVLSHLDYSLAINANKISYSEERCYFLGAQFGFVGKDNSVTYIDRAAGRSIGIVGINERTGYGYATKKFNEYYIEPYCEDTFLDFPNSMYYQLISYMLAIAFKIKQGADASGLSAQLQSAEEIFIETLGSDAFQFPRMGNVYR